jgi:hypothetical protein
VGEAAVVAVNAVAVSAHEAMAVPVLVLTPRVLLSSWRTKFVRTTNVSRVRMMLIARRRVVTSTNLKTSKRKRVSQTGTVPRR